MTKKILTTVAGAALLLMLSGPSARAQFYDSEVGARGLALGGAFVAIEGDPASLFWNASAILSERRIQVSGMRTRLYDGLDGVREDFVGLTVQITDDVGAGFGWTRVALEDLYTEDVLNWSAAYRVTADLQVGATLLFYGADAPGLKPLADPAYGGSQWKPSMSVSALYRWSEDLQFGASFENLLRPKISLLGDEEDVEPIGGRRRLGVAYMVQEIVRITAEYRHHDFPDYYNRNWTLHAGAESWFNDVLALRVGIDAGDLTAGVGLKVDRIRFDGGLVTNERLSNTFRAAITLGY